MKNFAESFVVDGIDHFWRRCRWLASAAIERHSCPQFREVQPTYSFTLSWFVGLQALLSPLVQQYNQCIALPGVTPCLHHARLPLKDILASLGRGRRRAETMKFREYLSTTRKEFHEMLNISHTRNWKDLVIGSECGQNYLDRNFTVNSQRSYPKSYNNFMFLSFIGNLKVEVARILKDLRRQPHCFARSFRFLSPLHCLIYDLLILLMLSVLFLELFM